jgi:lipoprotein NlpI
MPLGSRCDLLSGAFSRLRDTGESNIGDHDGRPNTAAEVFHAFSKEIENANQLPKIDLVRRELVGGRGNIRSLGFWPQSMGDRMGNRPSALLLALTCALTAGCEKINCLRVASPLCADARASDGFRTRGLAQLQSGNNDLAIAQFDSAIRVNPKDADSYNSRGNAYASKRDHDRAIASFDTALQLRPNYATAFKNRGVSYAARDEFARAIQDFDRAIALKPDYASAFNSRGFAYQLKGDYTQALRDYDRSVELAPENPITYRGRANARFIVGRFADAAADLERSVKFLEASTPAPARFNETGGYAVVWLHVAKMRQGKDDAAEFAINSARVDSAYWPRPVISFFRGSLTANQLVEQTSAVQDPKLRSDQRCGAEFFAGQAAMWKKNLAEARKRFETVTTTCSKRFVEHAAAAADLDRIRTALK